MNHLDVLKGPLVTEKLDHLREERRIYAFEVDRRASKIDVRAAVEKLFDVHVEDVHTLVMRGKSRRAGNKKVARPDWKKALVRLREGEKIDLFEGGA